MAEIGLAASIIGVAGAAAQISLGLFKIAAALGSAGKEVRAIANDSKLFSRVLEEIAPPIRNSPATSWRALAIADDLLTVCREVLGDSQELLDTLKPLVERTHHESLNIGLRVRWLVEKSKFVFLRDRYKSLEATLHLLVSTIGLSREADLESFTNLAFEVQALKETLENNLDGMRRHLATSNTAASIGNYLSITAAGTQGRASPRPRSINSATNSLPDQIAPSRSDDQQGSGAPELEDSASQLSIEEPFEDISSNNLLNPGTHETPMTETSAMVLVPYFRLMFAQERTVTYAADILNSPPTTQDTTSLEPGTGQAAEDNSRIRVESPITRRPASENNQSTSGISEPVVTSGQDSFVNTAFIPPIEIAQVPSEDSGPSSRHPRTMETSESSSIHRTTDFVYFLDAEGQRHSIAFEAARNIETLTRETLAILDITVASEYWKGRITRDFGSDPIYWVGGKDWSSSKTWRFHFAWSETVRPDWCFSIEFKEKDIDEKFGIARAVQRFREGEATGIPELKINYGEDYFELPQTSRKKFWKR